VPDTGSAGTALDVYVALRLAAAVWAAVSSARAGSATANTATDAKAAIVRSRAR
jgi:hypothetical protein